MSSRSKTEITSIRLNQWIWLGSDACPSAQRNVNQ